MAAASSFAIVAAAASAAASLYGGIQANQQAKAQASIYNQQAERERQQAKADEEEFRNQQQRAMARRRAVMGASGVDLSTGSPLLASEDFASETELQALKIRNGGEVRGTRLQQQAALTAAKGRSDMTSGFIRGGSLLFSAGEKAAEAKWFG